MDDITPTDQQKPPDYLSEIFSLCTTLSTEALESAESKARSNGLNVDRGDITFTELTINLASARDILSDAIEHQKLIQLPITVQKEILANLQAISRALQGLMNNTDEIVNLGSAVEVLNTSIWKYGLHNLSDQVLGFQTKMNQLKQQEVRANRLIALLEKGGTTSERVTELAHVAENAIDQIAQFRRQIEDDAAAAGLSRQQSQEESGKATAAATAASQAEAQSAQSAISAKSAAAEISPLEASIKGFFGEIDTYRKQLAISTDESSKFLTESSSSVSKAIAEIKPALNAEIDASQKAIGDLIDHFNKADLELIKQTSATELKREQDEHSAFVDAAEKKLADLEKELRGRSDETIGKNHDDTQKLLKELAILKESIHEQLVQATGYGQFGAFQARQNRIAKGKYLWVGAIAGLVVAVVVLTAYIAYHTQQADLHNAAFWIKLSMNLPLTFLITFCTIQYNRERRLEEEYAFKSSISVSLTPYRELIYSILEKDGALNDGTYTQFVVDAVRNVFTSPTEKIYASESHGLPEKALKQAAEVIGTVAKAAK